MNRVTFLILLTIFALLFLGCSKKSSSSAELSVTPDKWVVDYYLSESELDKDQENNTLNYRSQEFTVTNRDTSAELKIYQINFLSPSGEILSGANVKDLRPLFEIQLQDINNGLAQEGYSVSNSDYSFTGLDTLVRPLCPLAANESGELLCKAGFSSNYNNKLKIKLLYNKLDFDTYKSIASNTALKSTGNYSIEFCTNDSSMVTQPTCSKGTSLRIQVTRQPMLPPQPLLKVKFINPTAGTKDYRVIKDQVIMDLSDTKVSNPEDALLFDVSNDQYSDKYKSIRAYTGDQSRFRIKYRWELVETPTPLTVQTRITLDNISGGGEGQWYEDNSNQNPKLAHFKANRITPTPEGLYYKVKVQAITYDMSTDLESPITEVIVTPNIIPSARVAVELKWKNGLDTMAQLDRRQGTAVDLDLHFIKKKSLEGGHEAGKGDDGLMCGRHKLKNYGTGTAYHDDCYFNDKGTLDDSKGNKIEQTIGWGAAQDLDNTWGGGNFTNPETINLGPVDDFAPKDGKPDFDISDDEYLIVVNYALCQDLAEGSRNESCKEGGANYEVPVKVDVIVDGVYVPRDQTTDGAPYNDTLYREFIIHPNEWIVVSKIKWDRAAHGKNYPKWLGDATVTDNHAEYEKICSFPREECFLNTIPIWDQQKFYDFVTVADTTASYSEPRGVCK